MGGGSRILVVDDCSDTVDIVCTVLTLLGHEARGAATREHVLFELERFGPQSVLLDVELAADDGAEIARVIRARCDRPPRLIALTGWNLADARYARTRAAFDDFILKPAGIGVLRRALGDVPSRATTRERRLREVALAV